MYYPANVTNESSFEKIVDIILSKKSFDAGDKYKIDLLVYHLYGLTYDEVLVVDPETAITQEEYENSGK